MLTALKKFFVVLQSQNPVHRAFQAINKSPLKYLTKFIAVFCSFRIFLSRKKKAQKIVLTSDEFLILKDIQENGFADVTSLINSQNLLTLEKHALDKLNRVEKIKDIQLTKNKDFWIRLSDEDLVEKSLSNLHPLVNISLEKPLLKIIGVYFKSAAFLNSVAMTFSIFTKDQYKASQLWHKDPDDTKMIKFFIYITDVNTVADGPFTFLNKKTSKKVKNNFIMRHLRDDEIKKYVSEVDFLQMLKPKLSCFLVDTSVCYHMGSRVNEGHCRLMYTASFTALPSNHPFGGRETFIIEPKALLSELQKTALQIKSIV